MSIFEKSGWLSKVPFDLIINAVMEAESIIPEQNSEIL